MEIMTWSVDLIWGVHCQARPTGTAHHWSRAPVTLFCLSLFMTSVRAGYPPRYLHRWTRMEGAEEPKIMQPSDVYLGVSLGRVLFYMNNCGLIICLSRPPVVWAGVTTSSAWILCQFPRENILPLQLQSPLKPDLWSWTWRHVAGFPFQCTAKIKELVSLFQ